MLVCFLIIVSIVLLNILIAMMVNTYDLTAKFKNEWLRQVWDISMRFAEMLAIFFNFVYWKVGKDSVDYGAEFEQDRETQTAEEVYAFDE